MLARLRTLSVQYIREQMKYGVIVLPPQRDANLGDSPASIQRVDLMDADDESEYILSVRRTFSLQKGSPQFERRAGGSVASVSWEADERSSRAGIFDLSLSEPRPSLQS